MGLKKSQASTEYLILVSFVLILILPFSLFAFNSFRDNRDLMIVRQTEQAANLISGEAENVFYQGPPSMSKVKVYIPNNVFSASVSGYEISFRIKTEDGIDDVVAISGANMTGTIPSTPGYHFVTITTQGDVVVIS